MKQILLIVLCIFLIVGLIGCGGVQDTQQTAETVQTSSPLSLAEYREMISKNMADIEEVIIVLGNMGKYEYSYIEASAKISDRPLEQETVLKYTKEWVEEEGNVDLDEIEDLQNEIDNKHKEIITINIDDAEAVELKTSYKGLYDAYKELHRLINFPSLNLSSFGSAFSESLDNIQKYNEELSLLISE